LGSLLVDLVIMLPIIGLNAWGGAHYRLFDLYYLLPGTLFGLFYNVYLVRRFGGTPGKLIVGIRIRKVDGTPIGYREAMLRYFPDFAFGLATSTALIISSLHMSDTEYHSRSFVQLSEHLIALAPPWYKPVDWAENVWTWSELIVLLTNRKRRALHDFIAGTVVVHASQNTAPEAAATTASLSTRT
jgi:uncharacterized RDD family membrane protein YckC